MLLNNDRLWGFYEIITLAQGPGSSLQELYHLLADELVPRLHYSFTSTLSICRWLSLTSGGLQA